MTHGTDGGPPAAFNPGDGGALYQTSTFSLVNSGNRTMWAPSARGRPTWSPTAGGERLAGMSKVNLKAMYDDPSQMREALAWGLFATAGVPASRHTYAKLGLNGTYMACSR